MQRGSKHNFAAFKGKNNPLLVFEVTRALIIKKMRILNFKNFEKHFDEIPSETVIRKFKISFFGSIPFARETPSLFLFINGEHHLPVLSSVIHNWWLFVAIFSLDALLDFCLFVVHGHADFVNADHHPTIKARS